MERIADANDPRWTHRFSIYLYADGTGALYLSSRDIGTLPAALAVVPHLTACKPEPGKYLIDGRQWSLAPDGPRIRGSRRHVREIAKARSRIEVALEAAGPAGLSRRELVALQREATGSKAEAAERIVSRHLKVLRGYGLLKREWQDDRTARYIKVL